ncbi:hypothetical protein [Sphingomonas sp. AOB5]|uniref:hypothetical protein n=1 Tax=Sphingomonas sp. AOB5 TaxID=3034017 RepID=UPI0023F7E16E|nr:hypothetical protein [Sphingomonas sp. AOB5]
MRALTAEQATGATALALGLTQQDGDMLKAALRRALFWLAPASAADIIRFVLAPLEALGVERDAVETALEEMLAYGDALEMHKLGSDPWDAPRVVLRPAPPTFVQRADGSIILLGVAGDQPTALTPELAARVAEHGPVRRLPVQGDPSLPAHLRLLGLAQLSEAAWLRTPGAIAAGEFVRQWAERLSALPREAAAIPDLQILDPARPVRFYNGRWRPADAKSTGIFLARRPHRFGADLWSIAEFRNGSCHRLLDLGDDSDRQRPCDLAWRIQAAFDALAGHPQQVDLRHAGDVGRLDFFSPLPSFAERRLALVGDKQLGPGRLFSYALPFVAAEQEIRALRDLLWMELFDGKDQA